MQSETRYTPYHDWNKWTSKRLKRLRFLHLMVNHVRKAKKRLTKTKTDLQLLSLYAPIAMKKDFPIDVSIQLIDKIKERLTNEHDEIVEKIQGWMNKVEENQINESESVFYNKQDYQKSSEDESIMYEFMETSSFYLEQIQRSPTKEQDL